jgi:hypothetical protein
VCLAHVLTDQQMDAIISFIFRKKLYEGEMFIEDSEYPCFVFIIVRHQDIIEEFGDEIVLKTDYEALLPKKDDNYPGLLELRQVLFSIVKNTPLFLEAREKWQTKTA